MVIAARKLRHYFQSGPILVSTDQPLRQVLQKPETSGCLLNWIVELGEFDITYLPRTTIKAQALVDFIVELTNGVGEESKIDAWVIRVDGSSCSTGAGACIVLTGPDDFTCEYALRFGFPTINNGAEYEAVVLGMKLALQLGASRLLVYSDSQLVVGQIQSGMDVNEEHLRKYLSVVERPKGRFEKFQIEKIPREDNIQADALSKLASAAKSESKLVFVEVLDAPSYEQVEVLAIDIGTASWMTEICNFLQGVGIPGDKYEVDRLRRKASRYTMLDGRLYKRSFTLSLLKCLEEAEAQQVIHDIHEGEGASHYGGQVMAYQLLRQGFFWPTMKADAIDYAKKCTKCQKHGVDILQSGGELKSIVTPWPFAQRGLDLVGPLPKGSGQRRFLLVAVDYFTK